jgi:hypothetical protein
MQDEQVPDYKPTMRTSRQVKHLLSIRYRYWELGASRAAARSDFITCRYSCELVYRHDQTTKTFKVVSATQKEHQLQCYYCNYMIIRSIGAFWNVIIYTSVSTVSTM